jgi:thymidylate synthase
MRFEVETLDDALLKLYPELLSRKPNVTASRGDNTEILGVLIEVAQVKLAIRKRRQRG